MYCAAKSTIERMNESLLTINVIVADRCFPIHIKRKEEEKIREAVKHVNELILRFKEKYPAGADSKISTADYIAMAAVQVALKYVKLKEAKDINLFAGEIDDISKELEDYLKSEE